MLTKQLHKERRAINAATDYLFGRQSILIIGSSSKWQMEFMEKLLAPKKKGFLAALIEEISKAAEQERKKQMLPMISYRLESGETQSPELTEAEYKAIFEL